MVSKSTKGTDVLSSPVLWWVLITGISFGKENLIFLFGVELVGCEAPSEAGITPSEAGVAGRSVAPSEAVM